MNRAGGKNENKFKHKTVRCFVSSIMLYRRTGLVEMALVFAIVQPV